MHTVIKLLVPIYLCPFIHPSIHKFSDAHIPQMITFNFWQVRFGGDFNCLRTFLYSLNFRKMSMSHILEKL